MKKNDPPFQKKRNQPPGKLFPPRPRPEFRSEPFDLRPCYLAQFNREEVPRGALNCTHPRDLINPRDENGHQKLACSGSGCHNSTVIHDDCYDRFADQARQMREMESRTTNVWTPRHKQQFIEFRKRVIKCPCGSGHLELYIPAPPGQFQGQPQLQGNPPFLQDQMVPQGQGYLAPQVQGQPQLQGNPPFLQGQMMPEGQGYPIQEPQFNVNQDEGEAEQPEIIIPFPAEMNPVLPDQPLWLRSGSLSSAATGSQSSLSSTASSSQSFIDTPPVTCSPMSFSTSESTLATPNLHWNPVSSLTAPTNSAAPSNIDSTADASSLMEMLRLSNEAPPSAAAPSVSQDFIPGPPPVPVRLPFNQLFQQPAQGGSLQSSNFSSNMSGPYNLSTSSQLFPISGDGSGGAGADQQAASNFLFPIPQLPHPSNVSNIGALVYQGQLSQPQAQSNQLQGQLNLPSVNLATGAEQLGMALNLVAPPSHQRNRSGQSSSNRERTSFPLDDTVWQRNPSDQYPTENSDRHPSAGQQSYSCAMQTFPDFQNRSSDMMGHQSQRNPSGNHASGFQHAPNLQHISGSSGNPVQQRNLSGLSPSKFVSGSPNRPSGHKRSGSRNYSSELQSVPESSSQVSDVRHSGSQNYYSSPSKAASNLCNVSIVEDVPAQNFAGNHPSAGFLSYAAVAAGGAVNRSLQQLPKSEHGGASAAGGGANRGLQHLPMAQHGGAGAAGGAANIGLQQLPRAQPGGASAAGGAAHRNLQQLPMAQPGGALAAGGADNRGLQQLPMAQSEGARAGGGAANIGLQQLPMALPGGARADGGAANRGLQQLPMAQPGGAGAAGGAVNRNLQQLPIPQPGGARRSSGRMSGDGGFNEVFCPAQQSTAWSYAAAALQMGPNQRERNLSEPTRSSSGNIFFSRLNFKDVYDQDRRRLNPYFNMSNIDVHFGADEEINSALEALSRVKQNTMPCIMCETRLKIYEQFPLINGTLFVSPMSYNDFKIHVDPPSPNSSQKNSRSSSQRGRNPYISHIPQRPRTTSERNYRELEKPGGFLNAICMKCMAVRGRQIVICKYCRRGWPRYDLQTGGVYWYDILAAMPCCYSRITCGMCGHASFPLDAVEIKKWHHFEFPGLMYRMPHAEQKKTGSNNEEGQDWFIDLIKNFSFSMFSRQWECVACQDVDYHAVKPISHIFTLER